MNSKLLAAMAGVLLPAAALAQAGGGAMVFAPRIFPDNYNAQPAPPIPPEYKASPIKEVQADLA